MDLLLLPFCLMLVSLLLTYLIAQPSFIDKFYITFIFLFFIFTLFYSIAHYFTGAGLTEAVVDHLPLIFSLVSIRPYWGVAALGLLLLLLIPSIIFISFKHFRRRKFYLYTRPSLREPASWVGNFIVFISLTIHPLVVDTSVLINDKYLVRGEDILSNDVVIIDPNWRKDGQGKSLIYLYLESLDMMFFDERRFPGLTSELSTLFRESAVRFDGIFQAPMTGWTIAGMVSSLCGFPLVRHVSMTNEKAPCVGNVLSENRFFLSYFGGADAAFSGKKQFYTNQGFMEVHGASELILLAGDALPKSSWGIFDDDLFVLAFSRLESLINQSQPFGFILLTLDTHGPNGHRTPLCEGLTYGDGKSGTLNSVYCANFLTSQFIKKIINDSRFDDVLLVVASDHLMMANDIYPLENNFSDVEGRENLFAVFNSDLPPQIIRREASTLDIAPTLLSFLGFDVAAMGFGRNLLQDSATLTEKYGKDEFYRLIHVWRHHLMKRLSNPIEETSE